MTNTRSNSALVVSQQILAVLGGRSVTEAFRSEPEEMETSIAIGAAMMLSFAVVVTGQTLFLNSVPAFAPHAHLGGWLLGLLFVLVYRLIVRAMEVAGSVGKLMLFLIGGVIAGINTLMAGHELVLKVFEPQMNEQLVLNGNQSVDVYTREMNERLGLGNKVAEHDALRVRTAELRTALASRDPRTEQLAGQAVACRSEASALLARLPDRDSDRYARAIQVLLDKRRGCQRLEAESKAAQYLHEQRVQTELDDANASLRAATARLESARSTLTNEMNDKAPVLRQSAQQGFARHEALWQAAARGRVPLWAVAGLMAAALLVESLGMWLKVLLRQDVAAQERSLMALDLHEELQRRDTYGRAFHREVSPQLGKLARDDAMGPRGQDMAGIVGDEWQAQTATRAYARARDRVFRAYGVRRPTRHTHSHAGRQREDLPQPHRMMGAMTSLFTRMQNSFNRPHRQATQP